MSFLFFLRAIVGWLFGGPITLAWAAPAFLSWGSWVVADRRAQGAKDQSRRKTAVKLTPQHPSEAYPELSLSTTVPP